MIFVFGLGAAGNKAVIRAMELEVISKAHGSIINTTLKDIPSDYTENAIIIGKNKGCGKERSISLEAIKNYLKNNEMNLIPADVDRVVVVSSTEGGTGSGAAPILAKYIRTVLGYNVSIFAFTGFENDARGLSNTLNFMNELDKDLPVQIISNKKFLKEASGNFIKAQELANDEFCKRLLIMSGAILEESDQNIDDTDLHKLIDAPGLLDITYTDIEETIKNQDNFNDLCSSIIDETKSIDFEPSASRIGFIFNGKPTTRDAIDFSYRVLKNKYGEPFEVYTHIQDNKSFKKEFIAIIASGMKLPLEEMKKAKDEFLERSSKVSTGKDAFFDEIGDLKIDEDNNVFNMQKRNTTVSKDDFFKDFE